MEPFSEVLTIDVRRLRVLRELAQRGTVGATAEALHLTPSAVSQQIAALARETGVPLVAPRGRGVRLTPQALLLLDHAAAIGAQLERARADLAGFRDGSRGQVALGAFATAIAALVAPALARLGRERPGLRLVVREIEAPACFTRLDAGDLDLVVTVDYRLGPGRADARYGRLELLDDPLRILLPADHPRAAQAAVALADLAEDPWVSGAERGPCHEVGLAACAAAGFNPQVRHQVNDWGAAAALVAAGQGVALVPALALPGALPPGVAVRPPAGPQVPGRHLYAAYRAGAGDHPSLAPVLAALAAAARAAQEAERLQRPLPLAAK
jgi:DNA-binding transcriptional LysR family regulator